MNNAVIKKKFVFSVFVWSIIVNGLFLGCTQHGAVRATDYCGNLEPTKELSQTAMEVVKEVGQTHYVHHELDDRFSSAVFDRYLSDVDPARSSLLAMENGQPTIRNRPIRNAPEPQPQSVPPVGRLSVFHCPFQIDD